TAEGPCRPLSDPKPLHDQTPYWPHRGLPDTGRTTWVKMDAHQPTGSFKIRGVGLLCQRLYAQGATRFVCSSGGNAGLAAAYAAQQIGAAMTVVLPSTTPAFMRHRIEALGAQALIEGDVWDAA